MEYGKAIEVAFTQQAVQDGLEALSRQFAEDEHPPLEELRFGAMSMEEGKIILYWHGVDADGHEYLGKVDAPTTVEG